MRILAHVFAFFALLALGVQPVAAQSILRDAETEDFLDELAAPLIEAAGLEPGNVDIVLINDPSINAFMAGGQAVYLHSGLIDAADTANEVQGVVAHELGHITGGHIIRQGDGMARLNGGYGCSHLNHFGLPRRDGHSGDRIVATDIRQPKRGKTAGLQILSHGDIVLDRSFRVGKAAGHNANFHNLMLHFLTLN